MTFDELALDLINKTNGFTELNGAYKVVSKADVQNAETILRTYYQNVDKKKLDYTNNDAEGIDYMIRFDTPLYNFDLEESIKMNEDYVIKPTYRTKGVTREDVEKYAELLGLDYETALRRWKMIQAPESNYERVLDRLEPVDEAIEKHDTLNPKLWDSNNELKPEVRKKIEEIVQKFDNNLKENDVELDVKDICIIGSNANYNYSPDSDVDIHIIADTSVYPDQEDLAMKVYLAYKSLFNNKYDPMLNGIEAEVYVEPDAVKANSNGIYSLNQGWLKEPEQVDVPDIDHEHVQELVKPFEDRYNEVKVNPTIEDVDELIDDIYLQRQKSIMNDGEFGDGNICFKEFRNRGYLQDLRDLKVELENEEMSLNTFGEGVTRVFDLDDNELDLNEGIDLKAGQIFENGPEHTIEIISIDDDLVNYKEKDGNNEYEDTEYLPRLNAMLSEYGFKLAESLNEVKDVVPLDEDVWSNDNGTEFSFPNVRDTLAVYLEWEGIIGEAFLDDIMDFAEAGYDALSDYLDEEGIYGYTERIYNIFNGEPAWCSQMDEDDFVSVCRALYIDPNDAINYDDLTEDKDDVKVIFNPLEEGDYLGSKRDLTRDEKKMYLRSIPKFRVIPHPGNHIHKKPFTVQSGRHYQTVDDVYKDYPKDEYDVELVEATKVGLVSAAKSALNRYCDKLKDASAEEIYDKAVEHASKSEYPFVKDNLTAKKDIAIDYINKRREAVSMDDLDEDFVIDDKPGTKYQNKNGIVIEVIEPTADGLLQYEIIEDDKILDRRAVKDLKSFARMIDANGYKKLTEDNDVPKKIAKDYVIHSKKELDDFKADHEMFAGLFTKDEVNFPKALRLVADEYGGRDLWVEIPLDKAVVTDQLSLFNEEYEDYGTGIEFKFDDPEITLDLYLQWEGIIGFSDDIFEFGNIGYDDLEAYLNEEGIYGYTSQIYNIINGKPAFCRDMEEEDFISLCRSNFVDPKEAHDSSGATSIKNVRKYSVVDLIDGTRYDKYKTKEEAEGKAYRFAVDFRTKVAVIDDNNKFICGYDTNGNRINRLSEEYFDDPELDESLDEGTAFDSMPGYMTPEEVRAFNREKEAKVKAEKDAIRAEKKAAAKEKAKAERERQKRIDQREKVNSLSYDSLADMAGLEEDNNDLTKDELLAVLRANMSDEEILKLHKKMFEDLNESHKDYDLIFDRDTGDRQVEYGINWIQFTTDNYDDAVRWVRQLDAAMAGDFGPGHEPSDDPKYYDPENYPGDIQEVGDGKFNFRRRRDILDSIEKVDFVDADDDIQDLDETSNSPLNEDTDFTNKAAALSEYLDVEPSDISDTPEENVFEVGDSGQEYFVGTEEEAHAKAVEEIKMLFDDMGLDSFTSSFKKWILNNAIDMDAVNGIIDDEIDYFENSEDDPEMLEYLRGLNNDDDKVQFIKDLYGDSFSIWAKDYIDMDKVAEEAIKEDGVAHFVAYYDDNEVDLGNGLYAYRIN